MPQAGSLLSQRFGGGLTTAEGGGLDGELVRGGGTAVSSEDGRGRGYGARRQGPWRGRSSALA